MPSYTKPLRKLEYSPDDLSDTTPTYTDVTLDLIDVSWHGGKANLRDEPRPGGGTITLKSANRQWEPEHGIRNVDIGRRFRLYLDRGSGWEQQFLLYALDYEIDYPADTDYSVVTVTLGDGDAILEALERLDPADASSYADVVSFDDPSFYYRLGEPAGTKLVSRTRITPWISIPHSGGAARKYPFRNRRELVQLKELGGVSGPSGTYKGNPTLGEPGLILGDPATSVRFTYAGSNDKHARVPLDQSDLIDSNRLTVSAWIKIFDNDTGRIVSGPESTAAGDSVFRLGWTGTNLSGRVEFTDGSNATITGGTGLPISTVIHVGMTWDGQTLSIYLNGALEASGIVGGGKVLRQGTATAANPAYLYIARRAAAANETDAWIQDVAVFERSLSPERILAHYQAGAQRGFAAQLAGDRIEALATSSLWGETRVQAGSHTVVPRMKYGQARMDEIKDAVLAEQPYSLYFRDDDGDPVYLGWEYKGGGTYMTTQATFGPSNVPYDGVELDFDTEFYNDVTVSREDGPSQNVTDSASIAARLRHALEETIMVTEDSSALSVAGALLSEFRKPELRPVSLAVNHANALPQILDLEIGERIRVKGPSIDPWDRVTHILGFSKALSRDGILTCTWNLSRGFDAAAGQWRAGVTGFSEAGSTTVAG